VGFVVDKMAMEQVFSEYFDFPCQFSFHQLLDTHHLSSGAGIIGELVADSVSPHTKNPPPKKSLPEFLVQTFWYNTLTSTSVTLATHT
jgi:hypothetical protein